MVTSAANPVYGSDIACVNALPRTLKLEMVINSFLNLG